MNRKIINKKIIIFDLDGVLLDSVNFLRNYMKHKYEGMKEEDFKEIFLINFWDGLSRFKQKAEKEYIVHEEYSKNKRAETSDIPLFKGIKEVIKNLATKYTLVINSSDNESHIKERLEHNDVATFFSFVAGKEVSVNKAEKFNLILKQYNVSSDEVVFVTDTIGDVVEADKAGIDSIAVTWGVHSRDDFEKHYFDRLIFISEEVDDFYSLF